MVRRKYSVERMRRAFKLYKELQDNLMLITASVNIGDMDFDNFVECERYTTLRKTKLENWIEDKENYND